MQPAPKTVPKLAEEYSAITVFSSNQATITSFLGGVQLVNWEGCCLGLVILWLSSGNSILCDPAKGIINKTKALKLQNELEVSWKGLDSVQSKGQELINKTFWFKTDQLYELKASSPMYYFEIDPGGGREVFFVLALYFAKGSGHAVGVYRLTNGNLVFYDPNFGAYIFEQKYFKAFLDEFLKEQYPDAYAWGLCAWTSISS